MKYRRIVKIALDFIMVLLVALLYQKNAISLQFHEIAGLALLAFFAIHLALNRRWITAVTSHLFRKPISRKTQILYLTDGLLVLCWLMVILSGVLISKTLFHFQVSGPWKILHYSAAAFSLILLGVHAGLHWGFIRSLFGRYFVWLGRAAKPAGVVCAAVIVLFGAYSIKTTSFSRWLTMPFSVAGEQMNGQNAHAEKSGRPQARSAKSEMAPAEKGASGMQEHPRGAGGQSGFRPVAAMQVIASYGSILLFFAVLTGLLEWLLRKKKLQSGLSPNPSIA